MTYPYDLRDITGPEDAREVVMSFPKETTVYFAFDTETSGLHIMNDKPFMIQFGWLAPNVDNTIHAFAVDLTKHSAGFVDRILRSICYMARSSTLAMGHNVRFDLHMLKNIGITYTEDNITDTMFYIRYGTDAISARQGGTALGLKEFATKYITSDAKYHEQSLKQEQTAIAKQYRKSLSTALEMPMYAIDKLFSDMLTDVDDLPEDIREKYIAWRESLPDWLSYRMTKMLPTSADIPYFRLNRKNTMDYGKMDIVYTLETFMLMKGIVAQRQNETAVKIENSLIYPFMDMERVGFKMDFDYLRESKCRVKKYILQQRAELAKILGEPISISQHAKLKEILLNKYDVTLKSTQDDTLVMLKRSTEDPEVRRIVELVQELRTLEKWYSTYIMRFMRHEDDPNGRVYTTINQVGAISGRVSSDFQQFPKSPILDEDGEELFHPRRMIVTGDGYDGMVYLDYSQIELRIQAMYTLLVGDPDKNLCRAYMPYNCIDQDGVRFDPKNPAHLGRWKEPWFLEEDPTVRWSPVDVHGATTQHAFNITAEHPDYKKLRSVGKRVNFAKNYGASLKQIKLMFPDYSHAECVKIDEAYYKAFPGVKTYHNYCYNLAMQQSNAVNLFGVRYYNMSGHNLINLLVQGSAAFLLKIKIRQLWEYTKFNTHVKSRMQMNIHDEISFEKHPDDDMVTFLKFKKLMEMWADAYVPIVADMEITHTSWAEKEEVDCEAAAKE